MDKETKLIVLVSVFAVSLSAGLAVGAKLVSVLGITFSATAFSYAATFLVTDTISEVWGKKTAKKVVWIGFFTTLVMLLFIWIALLVPGASFWEGQEAFKQTFGLTPRLVLGGLIAYLISQHHDVVAFHFWRKKTKGKHLWFRNNASTWVSQFIDTVIFITIAFFGVIPTNALLATIGGQFLVKVIIAIVDTPFAYLLISWTNKKNARIPTTD